MKIFSHSRLSSFEQCKLKYKFRYIDKIIPDIEKTIESYLGSVVHSVLEWLYNQVKKNRIPTIDEVIVKYSEIWKAEYEEEIPIAKKQMTAGDYFNKGIQFLIDYYMKHKPFDDNTIEVEKEIIFNLDEDGKYKIKGFIDRLVYNLETEEYEVHDYKTSNNLPKQEFLDKDRQLALYSIAIKEIFGEEKKVILIWHYLSFNQKLYSKRTDEQLKKLKQETLELIKKIELTTEFPPKKSVLCGWCEYKQICSAFGNKPPEKQLLL
jgi:putative RecB family exonuclease|tara:strand:- start:1329 stop:2120 length:792 start_codon:yes stop_codon:yes gene_type:complete